MILRRIIYITVAVLGIAAIWFQMAAERSPRLPVYDSVPDFKLTERSGKAVTLSDLRGKIWIASFFYAICPGPCPVINGQLSALQGELLKGDDIRFVSISTEPETDTPEVLRTYAERFHASPDKWLFLTGDKEQIFKLSNQGFRLVAADQNDPQQPVVHSTKLALVDKSGRIRGYYDGTDETGIAEIKEALKALRRE